MKKQFTFFLILVFVLGISPNNTIAVGAPEITSISPSPVYEYDYVTILGENFEDCYPSLFEERAKIFLDDVEFSSYNTFSRPPSKWTNGQIVLGVGVKGGKLKIRNCDSLTSNEVDLVVIKRNPILTSLEPNKVYERFSYSTGPGENITVYGTDFGNTDPGSMYQFYLNGQHLNRGNISSWTNNSFKLYVPYELGGDDYGRGKIKVTPGDYELQIQLGLNSNHIYEYSNKITFTVLPSCTQDKWDCSEWSECSASGKKQRTCTKTFDCPSVETTPPSTTQSCVYIPPYIPPPQPTCLEDTWSCGDWGSCSPQGVQTRSCKRTFDCSGVETASPVISQYCSTNSPINEQQPTQTTNQGAFSQDQILKSTVRLICINQDGKTGKAGSGTIIDSYGTILTNYHVVEGTSGLCRVGFINNRKDNPNFTEMADVKSFSTSMVDAALLKIRGGDNKQFTFIDISKGNSDNLDFGARITTYGYPKPESYGPKITYTSGDFSGFGGPVIIDKYSYDLSAYFKTTAPIDHGNSGGGAYSDNGTFAGIPTLGPLGNVYYILSINSIKNWISSFTSNYNYRGIASRDLNNYFNSTDINLEDVDVRDVKLSSPSSPTTIIQKSKTTKEQTPNFKQPNQPQVESTVIESNNSDKKITEQNTASTTEEQKPKMSWIKRLFSWLANLFNKLATR